MIKKETIDKILETALIEEVVGDFVQLKKRGTSLIGLCPFHNEKSPSFHVSPAKGIFKCFGCGKGGDSVHFIMEHEKYSYPEALKYVANKYHIEVEETEVTPAFREAQDKRESLYIVSNYAAKFFADKMWNSEEGKTIGLSYFKERGFRDDIIKKFELGYSPDDWSALLDSAVKEGYQQEFLEQVGLVIKNDQGRVYDRFRGRVMFPIHNFTGRVIGFGGRTLKTDKSSPKYVNSPESDIYHKSNVLYGLFQAKKAIRDFDNCYLVEGYADVLSVQQAGVENVVASSGTSLTTEQIKLIGRFTKSVTILYDGDTAGIKASLRGLDMILEEGLDVKVVLFPDGHDPDSYIQKFGAAAFKSHIHTDKRDFIFYKIDFLLSEVNENDPIAKAKIFDEVAQTIALIKDELKRAEFSRKAAFAFNISERSFIQAVNKVIIKKSNKVDEKRYEIERTSYIDQNKNPEEVNRSFVDFAEPDEYQEKDMLRVLLMYGDRMAHWDESTDSYIGPYIILHLDDVVFNNPLYAKVVELYKKELEEGRLPTEKTFIQHPDRKIAELAVSLISTPYVLSENWYNMHNISVPEETEKLQGTVMGAIFHLKKKKIASILANKQKEIQEEKDAEKQLTLMVQYKELKELERYISSYLGSVIIK